MTHTPDYPQSLLNPSECCCPKESQKTTKLLPLLNLVHVGISHPPGTPPSVETHFLKHIFALRKVFDPGAHLYNRAPLSKRLDHPLAKQQTVLLHYNSVFCFTRGHRATLNTTVVRTTGISLIPTLGNTTASIPSIVTTKSGL